MHPQSSSRKDGTSSQFREVEDAITKQSVISPPGAAGEDWCEKYQKRWASARQWASRKPTVDWILPVGKNGERSLVQWWLWIVYYQMKRRLWEQICVLRFNFEHSCPLCWYISLTYSVRWFMQCRLQKHNCLSSRTKSIKIRIRYVISIQYTLFYSSLHIYSFIRFLLKWALLKTKDLNNLICNKCVLVVLFP